jgi:hypothetical protein
MYVNITSPFLGSSFIILGVILSIPGTFLRFKNPISSLTPLGVIILIGKIFCGNVVIASSISWSV